MNTETNTLPAPREEKTAPTPTGRIEGHGGFTKALEIPCRATKMGALTTIRVYKQDKGKAVVKKFNISKTGHHWVEALYVSPNFEGAVCVVDVSNSGKHYCEFIVFFGGRAIAKFKNDGVSECIICELLEAEGGI